MVEGQHPTSRVSVSPPSSDLVPLTWSSPRAAYFSAWHGHIAFAHWIVAALAPSSVVELGSHNGTSYFAFCNAVKKLGLQATCVAVDTWAGDEHAGTYGNEIFDDVTLFNDTHFAPFSMLLRMTFDEALAQIPDRSVDLLHIDGLHTYNAVRHDYETWLPKLSDRGVVLFHDIAVHERNFGVWRLWEEISANRPHFAFTHSAGLGVLAHGSNVSEQVLDLCRSSANAADTVRSLMERCSVLAQLGGLAEVKRVEIQPWGRGGRNIALSCAASQSSFGETQAPTPQGAVNGVKTGGFGFHTAFEQRPWWKADLGKASWFDEIVIFNRLDPFCPQRSRTIEISTSLDDLEWTKIYSHDGTIFGGNDGRPLVVRCPRTSARYVLLRLRDTDYLHLDEVEIYEAKFD